MPGREHCVSDAEEGQRLDKWLAGQERLRSRGRASSALARGQVFVDGEEQSSDDAGRRLVSGQRVRLWIDRPGSASRRPARRRDELVVVYEDDSMLVADKPAGLLTVPLPDESEGGSLRELVLQHWRSHGKREPLVVHRIDRDTSGLVVFAKTASAWRALKEQFARREPDRRYLALAEGRPNPPAGTWRDWLWWNAKALRQEPAASRSGRALEAVTHYLVLETFEEMSLLECRLVSGRQHQIRVQASLHGHPLIGERTYRSTVQGTPPVAFPRQALHAAHLGFNHPRTGRGMTFEAPLPADFARLIDDLRHRTDFM
jgi:23S rRNA pseudouridine1911/1915/1917 synthase